jgi:hypothetical protein
MPHEDRGIAVGLSLGGKAARAAQGLSHAVLGRRDGLYWLLQRIEQELGSELQDRVRSAGRTFMRFRRQRGQNATEYVAEFERLYAEGIAHGLWFNNTMLSMLLVEHAGLSESQEAWILQTVAADWTKYNEIRTALRRLPGLDTRHGSDANAWMAAPADQPDCNQQPNYDYNAGPARPLQEHRLNTPAQEGPPPLIPEWSADPSFAGAVEDDDSDSDDDYCSSCSDNDDPDFLPLQQAWAIVRHKKYVHKKQFGRKPYRRFPPQEVHMGFRCEEKPVHGRTRWMG